MSEKMQYLSFKIGSRLFGVDIIAVREVNRSVKVVHIPRSGSTVLGVANLRGYLVTVLAPSVIFDVNSEGKAKVYEDFPCVILKTAAEASMSNAGVELAEELMPEMVGLQVDSIGEVMEVDSGMIEPSPANVNGVEQRYLNGVVRLDSGLMLLVNLKEVLRIDSLSG